MAKAIVEDSRMKLEHLRGKEQKILKTDWKLRADLQTLLRTATEGSSRLL